MKSLSDVVSGAGLHIYAEVALVIFFAVFIAIVLRVLIAKRSTWEHEANLPLEDDDAPPHPSPDQGTRHADQ
ncbi:MAG TPA: cbb3-type cytochrome c oxidase subunit 3 [Gemmatimonadaceae bacterium]|nr:cbb3-type cytochrome c oxidase subunit 3 [Gemmatimonadaceae bacterium]